MNSSWGYSLIRNHPIQNPNMTHKSSKNKIKWNKSTSDIFNISFLANFQPNRILWGERWPIKGREGWDQWPVNSSWWHMSLMSVTHHPRVTGVRSSSPLSPNDQSEASICLCWPMRGPELGCGSCANVCRLPAGRGHDLTVPGHSHPVTWDGDISQFVNIAKL